MTTVLQQRTIPEQLRTCTTITPDYADVFTLQTPDATRSSPEQWARAGLERAAGLGGQLVWRVLLALRLAPRSSPDHVAGWKIARRGDDWITLEAASWFMTANIVVRVDEGEVSVATCIRYDKPIGALIWPPLSGGHRRAMPGLLRRASKVRLAA